MMWSLCHSLICFAAMVDVTFVRASSLDSLRRPLNVNPVSSHMRDRIIPHNVNIPVSDIQAVASNIQGLLPESNGIAAPQKAESMIQTQVMEISQPSVAGKPVVPKQRIIDRLVQIQVLEEPVLQPLQQRTLQSVPQLIRQPVPQLKRQPAPQPALQTVQQLLEQPASQLVEQLVPQLVRQPVPQLPPQSIPQPAPQKAITMSGVIRQSSINDRLLNSVGTIDTSLSAEGCSFQIPSFLLPGPDTTQPRSALRCPSFLLPGSGPSINSELINVLAKHWAGDKKETAAQVNDVRSRINQIEFEQKCLLPVLRAHVIGGQACRTRELAVYLEWLLYLRERLFNI